MCKRRRGPCTGLVAIFANVAGCKMVGGLARCLGTIMAVGTGACDAGVVKGCGSPC